MAKKPQDSHDFLTDVASMRQMVADIHKHIYTQIADIGHRAAFKEKTEENTKKRSVYIDDEAENLFFKQLAKFPNVGRLGEESLENFDEMGKHYLVLSDIIDGTDLLQRGLSNWCSAIVVVNNKTQQIVASYVGVDGARFYYATDQDRQSFSVPLNTMSSQNTPNPRILKVNDKVKSLSDASICIYTQKGGHLLDFISRFGKDSAFAKWLEHNTNEKKLSKFRFYNFAGNPMMARLAGGDGIDLVCDLRGVQKPHDILPGVIIARKAGAVFGAADREHEYTDSELYEMLRDPAKGIGYILASTKELYKDAQNILHG